MLKKKEFAKNLKEALEIFGEGSKLGFVITLPLVLGTLLGVWLDSALKTKPFLTILFLILGLVVGLKGALKIVKFFLEDKKRVKK